MSREGQPYTREEDDLIRWGYATGADVNLMAKHLGRTVAAIRVRASFIKAARPRRRKVLEHKYAVKGQAEPPIIALTAEDKFARVMGNKRFEDVRIKGERV